MMENNLDEMLREAPTLTFEPDIFSEKKQVSAESGAQSGNEVSEKEPEVVLSPQEQKMVDDFAAQIDITNTQMVLCYGAGSQKKIADFSENALNNVRTKDMGEIGQMLTEVVGELKNFEEEE